MFAQESAERLGARSLIGLGASLAGGNDIRRSKGEHSDAGDDASEVA